MPALLLGEAIVDLICERPVSGYEEADCFVPHFGGAVANVAVTAARQGAEVALAGGAGDDPWGAWLRARLDDEGVDLRWFELVEGFGTPLAFVTVDAGGEPAFQIYGEGIAATVRAVGPRLDDAIDASDGFFFSSNTLVGEDERGLTMRARERALRAPCRSPSIRTCACIAGRRSGRRWTPAGSAWRARCSCAPTAPRRAS